MYDNNKMKKLNIILMVGSLLIILFILYSSASVKFSGSNQNSKNQSNNESNNEADVLRRQNKKAKLLLDRSKKESVLQQLSDNLKHINSKFYYDNCRYEQL